MSGGLKGWKDNGAHLDGDIFAQQELNKMPPQVFFEERNDENWLVIDVSESKNTEARNVIPQAVDIPFGGDIEDFVSRLGKIVSRHKKEPFYSVLIFNERGEQYEIIEKLIQTTEIRNVFYLKDGLNGYEAFLHRQTLIWKRGDHTKKRSKRCPTCPPE